MGTFFFSETKLNFARKRRKSNRNEGKKMKEWMKHGRGRTPPIGLAWAIVQATVFLAVFWPYALFSHTLFAFLRFNCAFVADRISRERVLERVKREKRREGGRWELVACGSPHQTRPRLFAMTIYRLRINWRFYFPLSFFYYFFLYIYSNFWLIFIFIYSNLIRSSLL